MTVAPGYNGRSADRNFVFAEGLSRCLQQLREIWRGDGHPPVAEIATRTGVAATKFDFLVHTAERIPTFEAVAALLSYHGATDGKVLDQWQRRLATLKRLNPETRNGESEDGRVNEPVAPTPREHRSPLARALKAVDMETFVEQVRALRSASGLSFEAIAQGSNNRITRSTAHRVVQPGNSPAHEEQVRHFVSACGQNEAETQLWVMAYRQVCEKERIRMTVRRAHNTTGDPDLPRKLEALADDLASRGEYGQAYRLMKSALESQRRVTEQVLGRPTPTPLTPSTSESAVSVTVNPRSTAPSILDWSRTT